MLQAQRTKQTFSSLFWPLFGVLSYLLLAHSGIANWTLQLFVALVFIIVLPSARNFSARVGLNTLLMLGLAPLFGWTLALLGVNEFSQIGSIQSIVMLLISLSTLSRQLRSDAFVKFRGVDIFTVLAASTAMIFYWPLLTMAAGTEAVVALTQAFSGDIVGHYDMVKMSLDTGLSGWWWGNGSDGTYFVYATYPQGFHSLIALFGGEQAQLNTQSIESGTVEFFRGFAIVNILELTSLVALSIAFLQKSVSKMWVAIPAAAIFALFATGNIASQNLDGFPNFVFAVFGLTALLFVPLVESTHLGYRFWVLAGAISLIANSWALLLPLGIVIAVLEVVVSRREIRKSIPALKTNYALSGLTAIWAVCWAGFLIFGATAGVGGPVGVLSVPGGIKGIPLPWIAAAGLACVAISAAALLSTTYRKNKLFQVIFIASFGGILMTISLLVQQYPAYGWGGNYYARKFASGFFFVCASALAVMATVLFNGAISQTPKRQLWLGRLISVALTAAIIFVFGTPTPGYSSAWGMRQIIATPPSSALPAVKDLLNASEVISSAPCGVIVYLGSSERDGRYDMANQWAHALSGRWTEASAPINRFLAEHDPSIEARDTAGITTELLTRFSDSCVVINPNLIKEISEVVPASLRSRVLTW